MDLKCELSVEELEQLLEENRKNYRLLAGLLKSAGVETESLSTADEVRKEKPNLNLPAEPNGLTQETKQKWDAFRGILETEIADYEENEEELSSLKYLCRTSEEYADLEQDVETSGAMIRAIQEVLSLLEQRERIRRGEN